MTLSQALEEYKDIYLAARNYAKKTRVEYAYDTNELVSFLENAGITKVGELGITLLEHYLAELDCRCATGNTRRRKVVSVRSFLSFLYLNRYISANFSKHIIPPRIDEALPRFLTEGEYNRLLEAASSSKRDYALIQLLLQTGIKLSEVTSLSISDVELPPAESNQVGYVHIKGSERQQERVLPLNSKACSALKTYIDSRYAKPDAPLFLNRFRKRLGARGVEKIIGKYLEEASIEKANVQSLRHTFGTHHVAKGTSIKTVQEVMGYKDPRTTSVYISLAKQISVREIEEHSL